MNSYPHLFSSYEVKGLRLKNRAVMPPMGTNLANPDGSVSEELLAYLRRRARGGAGLIIVEVTAVHPTAPSIDRELAIHDDRFIPGLRRIVDAVHEAGPRVGIQLHHAGRESPLLLGRGEAIAPSAVPSVVFRGRPREMTLEEIRQVIEAFGTAARRAKEAGFDMVEIHAAHGYLLMQFLSAISNRRQDEYGGDIWGRSRFITEVVREVREAVGPGYPVSLRISTDESIKGGYTLEEILPVIPVWVEAGADLIHASIGTHGSPGGITSATPEYPEGFNLRRAALIREQVGVPVIAVDRFSDPALADRAIERGEADLVAFGRQHLADPDFLIKAGEGKEDQIRKCLFCNQGCIERLILGEGSIRCSINPETGQELLYPVTPASHAKDVWVVGAGPAGLTAAYEAARLGHRVRLFESQGEVGGQVRFGSRAPHKGLYMEWIRWLFRQVRDAGVDIHLGTEVTSERLERERPGAVILATGVELANPGIKGMDQPHVVDALSVLGERVPPGENVVIIGGGLVGMETADLLLSRGSTVCLVEQLERSPVPRITGHGYWLHRRFRDGGGRLLLGTTVSRIGGDFVEVSNQEGNRVLSPVDQVILATGFRPKRDLAETLKRLQIPHWVVGDANGVRRIIEAVEEGAGAAWEV